MCIIYGVRGIHGVMQYCVISLYLLGYFAGTWLDVTYIHRVVKLNVSASAWLSIQVV